LAPGLYSPPNFPSILDISMDPPLSGQALLPPPSQPRFPDILFVLLIPVFYPASPFLRPRSSLVLGYNLSRHCRLRATDKITTKPHSRFIGRYLLMLVGLASPQLFDHFLPPQGCPSTTIFVRNLKNSQCGVPSLASNQLPNSFFFVLHPSFQTPMPILLPILPSCKYRVPCKRFSAPLTPGENALFLSFPLACSSFNFHVHGHYVSPPPPILPFDKLTISMER